MMYLDLDELPELFDDLPGCSARRPAPAWFRRADHAGDPAEPLADTVRELVRHAGGPRCDGPVRLLTHLRYLGHCFNPVSFYYCYAPGGAEIDAIVAEVTNTPWGDRHCYLLLPAAGGELRGVVEKRLHVSPFMPMAQSYTWHATAPGERLDVTIESREEERVVFDAALSLERRELTRANMARLLARHPAMTLSGVAAIYGQALRLWRKGATYHPRPAVAR
jgi:DUF1365 family protein